jgi:hypothetical protein
MNFGIDKNDILEIRAIHKDYLTELSGIILKSKSIKGTSAYWTLDFPSKGNGKLTTYTNHFYELLRGEDSFMCVDLHLPTSVEKISTAVNYGCNFYMFLLEGKGDIYKEINNKLLHSKVIVFEGVDYDHVLIGSHNQTNQALRGLNEEFSLLLKIDNQSETKRNIIEYLDFIRSLCVKLPSGNLEKWMLDLVQKKGKMEGIENMNFIECTVLKDSTYKSIKIGSLIHLISFIKIDATQLAKINDNFCLSIQTRDGSSRKYMLVQVDKSSNVDENIKKDSTGQSFENRHYFYHGLSKDHCFVTPSVIFPKKNLNSNYFRENKFNLELKVIQEINTIRKTNEVSPLIDPWIDCDETSEELKRFLLQFDSLQEVNSDNQTSLYKSIRIIDKELLERIFNSENEASFKNSHQKLIIEKLGESVPLYSIGDNYLKIFKELDLYISESKIKKGRPNQNTVITEFERLFNLHKGTEDNVQIIYGNKMKKINSKHTFINKGIAITKEIS